MTQIEHLSTQIHGRYLLEVPEGVENPPLLVGFHGYGENAERHLEKLRNIPGSDTWLLCSVAALHPFYTKAGEVVASWMTKQDRELALEDNIRWVSRVVQTVRSERATSPTVVFAGFSQGVAMAWRAALCSGAPCAGLIALAGDVPPEFHESMNVPPLLLGRGTQDLWYTEEKMNQDLEILRRNGGRFDAPTGQGVETCVFEGGHDWTEPFYRACGRFLAAVND